MRRLAPWAVWGGIGVVIVADAVLLWYGEFSLVALNTATFLAGYFWPWR